MSNFTKTIKDPSEFRGFPNGIYPMGSTTPSGVFSHDAHENLIKSKGFKAVHYRHALNPKRSTPGEGVDLNQVDLSGYNYYDPHELYLVPQNLQWDDLYTVQGIFGKHSMTANYTGYYNDEPEKRTFLRPDDILISVDENVGTVLCEDLVEWKPALPIKCKFPILSIDYIADGDNRYDVDNDFVISSDGLIYWKDNARKPRFDNRINKGIPLSIVYWTRPYYIVLATPKPFRMAYNNTYANAGLPSDLVYYPGLAVLQMMWVSPSISGFDWLGVKI